MNDEQTKELERLRGLASESLLSMAQVDWLLTMLDIERKRAARFELLTGTDLGWDDIAEAAGLDRNDWDWNQLRDAVGDSHFEKSGAAEERAQIAAWLRTHALYQEACHGGPLMSASVGPWLADRIEKGDHVPIRRRGWLTVIRAARALLDVAYPAYCRARPISAVSVTPWNELVEAMDNLRNALET